MNENAPEPPPTCATVAAAALPAIAGAIVVPGDAGEGAR